jgi:hypothetical protein
MFPLAILHLPNLRSHVSKTKKEAPRMAKQPAEAGKISKSSIIEILAEI